MSRSVRATRGRIVVGVLFRQAVAALDAFALALGNGDVDAAEVHSRGALEASLSIEWAPAVPHVIFGLMRHLRTSGLPAILLSLLMAVGVLLPEAGHSFAHRQGGGHAEHELVSQMQAGLGVAAAVSSGHAADDHPHFELAATLPGKPLLAYAVAAQTVFRLLLDGNTGLQVPAATARTLAPPQSNHGPPPPTRAPPIV